MDDGFVVTREYRRFAQFCDACRKPERALTGGHHLLPTIRMADPRPAMTASGASSTVSKLHSRT